MFKTYPIVMDDDSHRRVKTAAAKSGKSMKDFIIEAIEAHVKKAEKK